MATIIGTHIECDWCNRHYDTPRQMLRYDDKFFCDDECLGEYLVDRAEGDIEEIWFDTPENIEICEKEQRAEW